MATSQCEKNNSNRSTLTANADSFNILALITFFSTYYRMRRFADLIPFLFRRLWPPSISYSIGIAFSLSYTTLNRNVRIFKIKY